eukprot:976445-Rhodomonas_salina.5
MSVFCEFIGEMVALMEDAMPLTAAMLTLTEGTQQPRGGAPRRVAQVRRPIQRQNTQSQHTLVPGGCLLSLFPPGAPCPALSARAVRCGAGEWSAEFPMHAAAGHLFLPFACCSS